MKITVIGTGALVKKVGMDSTLSMEPDSTLIMIKEKIGLSINYPMMFTVNGKLQRPDTKLQDGDEVKIMNIPSGG